MNKITICVKHTMSLHKYAWSVRKKIIIIIQQKFFSFFQTHIHTQTHEKWCYAKLLSGHFLTSFHAKKSKWNALEKYFVIVCMRSPLFHCKFNSCFSYPCKVVCVFVRVFIYLCCRPDNCKEFLLVCVCVCMYERWSEMINWRKYA